MTSYLFPEEEIKILKFIELNAPIRIWYEHIQYVFEYENFYFVLEIYVADKFLLSDPIDTSHKDFLTQYVLAVKMRFIDEKFQPQQGSELLSDQKKIKIKIVRTKLYFTKHEQVSSTFYNSQSSQINPDHELPNNLEIKKVVIADVGLILCTSDGKILNIFLDDNDDTFSSNDYKYRQGDFFKELDSRYQFIDL